MKDHPSICRRGLPPKHPTSRASLIPLILLVFMLAPIAVFAQGRVEISAPEEEKVICKDASATVMADITCEGDKHRNPDVEVTYGGDADEDGTIITDEAGKKSLTATADGCSEDERTVFVIELEKESPAESRPNVVYDAERVGWLGFRVAGTTGVEELDEDIEWKLDPIAGSVPEKNPATGADFAFWLQGLPEENSGMGKKKLTMTYPEAGCKDVEMTLQLYFMPDTKGNGVENLPNWYYYWWYTRAGGDRKHLYAEACTDDEGDDLYGFYNYGETVYHVCALANQPSTRQESCPSTTTGIDTFAVTVIHERQHMITYFAWWDPYDPEKDLDDDRVPDDMEEEMGFDPEKNDTDGDGLYDEHDLVWNTECTWLIGAADKQDWSFGGKQGPR